MMIIELRYNRTQTYLIAGRQGYLLFDTDWAGTFPLFCRELKKKGIRETELVCVMLSHFHPDHMGIAQNIAELGAQIVVFDVQREYTHRADSILAGEVDSDFLPLDDSRAAIVPVEESRAFLHSVGIDGEVIATPGHSEDSISLCLDDGCCLVGDLNPLCELERHKGTIIEDSWNKLLERNPKVIYYGHSKTEVRQQEKRQQEDISVKAKKAAKKREELFELVADMLRYIDRGMSVERIQKKTKADREFIEDVMRMYLTHQNVGVQGVLDRIEIKNR